MQKIKLSDIDISSLELLSSQGSCGKVYRKENVCYKFLDELYTSEKMELYRKFDLMQGIKLDNVIFPNELIMQNGILCGYTMDYFEDSKTLNDIFLKSEYLDCKKLLEYIKKSCQILRNIHMNEIIYQDLSFDNILIDSKGNIKFCDLDGCKFEDINGPFISALLNNFLINYRRKSIIYVVENYDRLSMLLSFIYVLYYKELKQLTNKEYNYLSSEIKTLENLKKCVIDLLDVTKVIEDIPYLDEFIDSNDDYVIDRNKQFTLFKK